MPLLGVELVRNGSFEGAGGSSMKTDWNDGPGLGNDRGFGDKQYPGFLNGRVEFGDGVFEFPPGALDPSFEGIVAPVGAGGLFGFKWGDGNGDGVRGSATQLVNVADYVGNAFEFSAWLAGSDSVYPIVSLEFFDQLSVGAVPIQSIVFDGSNQSDTSIVGSLSLTGFADSTIPATQGNWKLYRIAESIPSNAELGAITITSATSMGLDGQDAFVDLVSLRVVPEPASYMLALVVVTLALVVVKRRSLDSAASQKGAHN